MQVNVGYKAVKHAFQAEGTGNLHLAFARVIAANGAQKVGQAGEIVEPVSLWNGDQLKPGDMVQVGNDLATTAMSLQIQFCDGQVALLQSETSPVLGVLAVQYLCFICGLKSVQF